MLPGSVSRGAADPNPGAVQMLTLSEVSIIRGRLLERRAELAERVERRLHGHGLERHAEAGLPRRSEDTDDDATAEMQREADVIQLARAAEELRTIEQALARIDQDAYGECNDCGGTIELQRLLASPTAMRCTDCQALAEARERRLHIPRT
jgi:DnaK suppressor protein